MQLPYYAQAGPMLCVVLCHACPAMNCPSKYCSSVPAQAGLDPMQCCAVVLDVMQCNATPFPANPDHAQPVCNCKSRSLPIHEHQYASPAEPG